MKNQFEGDYSSTEEFDKIIIKNPKTVSEIKKKRKIKKMKIKTLVLLILVIVIIGSSGYLKMKNDKQKEQEEKYYDKQKKELLFI